MKSSLEEVIPIALSYRIIKNTEPLEEKKLTSLDLSQYMEKSEALKQDEIRKIIKREDPMDVVKREIRKNLEEEIEIKKTAMLEKARHTAAALGADIAALREEQRSNQPVQRNGDSIVAWCDRPGRLAHVETPCQATTLARSLRNEMR